MLIRDTVKATKYLNSRSQQSKQSRARAERTPSFTARICRSMLVNFDSLLFTVLMASVLSLSNSHTQRPLFRFLKVKADVSVVTVNASALSRPGLKVMLWPFSRSCENGRMLATASA